MFCRVYNSQQTAMLNKNNIAFQKGDKRSLSLRPTEYVKWKAFTDTGLKQWFRNCGPGNTSVPGAGPKCSSSEIE
jgi:hypothetical protein